jgi:hypothetical protein
MKAIRKSGEAVRDTQSNIAAYKKIDKLLKKHSIIQEEENRSGERQLRNLKNPNDGL